MYGIIGATARNLGEFLDKFQDRDNVGDSDEGHERVWGNLKCRLDKIESAGLRLPIYFFRSYIDSWSVANSQFRSIPSSFAKVIGSDYGCAFYLRANSNLDLEIIKDSKNLALLNAQVEDYWFCSTLLDCCENMRWIEDDYVVIAYSQILDSSWDDEEIKKSALISDEKIV